MCSIDRYFLNSFQKINWGGGKTFSFKSEGAVAPPSSHELPMPRTGQGHTNQFSAVCQTTKF